MDMKPYDDVTEYEKGWTDAAIALVAIWNVYREAAEGDNEVLVKKMNAFFLGCELRFSGASMNEVIAAYGQESSV